MREPKYFQNEIQRRYPTEHSRVWSDIEQRFGIIAPDVAFARTSSNPVDKRLPFCAYFLATIQVLEKRGESFESIRTICLAITHEFVRPKSAWGRWLKRLPSKLMRTPLLRVAKQFIRTRAGSRGHPDGFLVQIVTDPAETLGLGYGIDIVECGVVKLFRKYDAQQYVPILCEVDELTSSLAGLQLVRSGTIAGGAPRCDFRYRLPGPKR
jgi:hypothetical protein